MASSVRQPALLGIDVGTSAVKLLLYFLGDARPRAERIRVSRARLDVSHPHPGWSEIDPKAWWHGIRRAAKRLDLSDAQVLGIGTSTLFPALVPLVGGRQPARPAILYNDARSAAEVEDLASSPLTHPALIHLLTGNLVRPGTIALSSMLWMRKHEPDLFDRVRHWGLAGSYVGLRLTERWAADASSASLTGLYATASGWAWLNGVFRASGVAPDQLPRDPTGMTYGQYLDLVARGRPGLRERAMADVPPGFDLSAHLDQPVSLPERGWVPGLCDALGIDRRWLPEVLWPTERLFEGLAPMAARTLGLEPGIPVAVGAGDTVCGALGLGLTEESEATLTCGSTDCLTSFHRTAAFSTQTCNMTYMDDETWLSVAPMNTTGAAVDWFVGNFIGLGPKRFDRFFGRAAEAPAGSRGLVFLPYLAGERSPVYDPRAKGVFFGLTLQTGAAEMCRAVLEGIAFGHRQLLQMADLRLGRPVERVLAAGGGAAHPLGRQVRADAADRPYLYADLPEVSAFGAALLGGVAAGVFPTWQDAAAEARRFVRFTEVRPNPDGWHKLKHNFEVYSSLYEALKHCF